MIDESFKEKLNKQIKEKENPSIQYYLIKQNYLNLKNNFINIDEFIDKDFIKKAQKLEIFRSVMQYIEEFTLYFSSFLDKQDISILLVKTQNKKINKLYDMIENNSEDLLSRYNYKSCNELFYNVFNCNDERSLLNIKKVMYNIAYFWNNYKDIYNSIKHGYRFFKKDITHFSIDDEKNELIPINEEYIEIICKFDSNPYSLIYPINYLLDLSMNILEDIYNIFNFLLRTNQYKNEELFKFFSKTNLSNNYIKAYNGEVSLILPNSPDLKDKFTKGLIFKFCNFSLNKKNLSISLNDSQSTDFPFGILLKLSKSQDNLPFSRVSEIHLINSVWFDVSQVYNLKKINEFQLSNNLKYKFVNDTSLKPKDELIFYIDDKIINYPDTILEKLVNLEKILGIDIPTPFDLTDMQKKKLVSFNSTSLNYKQCNEFLINLKSLNRDKLKIYLIINKNKKIIKKYLGHTFDLDFFKIDKKNIKDIGNNFSANFCFDSEINLLEIFINMKEKLIGGESLDSLSFNNMDNIHFFTEYDEVFWFNEYKLTFVIDV